MTQGPNHHRHQQPPYGYPAPPGAYPQPGIQPPPRQVSKDSAWDKFKRWPLLGKIATVGCGGLFALFLVASVLGGLLMAMGFDSGEDQEEAAETQGIEVPDLEGAVARDARAELEELGFAVDLSADEGSVWNSDNWVVLSTDPSAGERADEGAEITVNVVRPEEDEPEAMETETPDNSTDGATEQGGDSERYDIYQIDNASGGKDTYVEFDIADSFTMGMISRGARTSTLEGLQEGLARYPEYDRIVVHGRFPTVDAYGNESHSLVLNAVYERSTVERINFDNHVVSDSIWEIRDAGGIHPDFDQ